MNELMHHNLPPDMAATAGDIAKDLSAFMAEHPHISDEDAAREAKVYIDRGSLAIKDLEDERTDKVRPLNEQVKSINDHYRGPRELLETVLNDLKGRVTAFLLLEERKRLIAAEEARRNAEEAKRIARGAEAREQQALDEANGGVLGIDIAAVTATADKAFEEYKKAEHQAAIAERDSKVRLGGGFSRAIGLKEKETLYVTDAIAAIKIMGVTQYIEEAVIKSARAYRKLHNSLPDGIETSSERSM